MDIAVFSTKPYDRQFLHAANADHGHKMTFLKPHLAIETCPLAAGFTTVCVFVNDQLPAPVLEKLARNSTRLIALRCAGFNNVDLAAADKLGLAVVRVPAYSPYAVAEHTVALMLALNRKVHRAYNRVREGNFVLEGLLGFDMHGRTVGIIGTGKIGMVTAKIMNGFGCHVIAYDLQPNPECEAMGVKYVGLSKLLNNSDIITLHCPLTPKTHHLINDEALQQMKDGVMLINTSRGALIDTKAATEALKSGKIGNLGMDVYEEESDLFFEDLSNYVLQDDVFARLLTFPNVIITGHQGFLTRDAVDNIARTTLRNVTDFELGRICPKNEVKVAHVVK